MEKRKAARGQELPPKEVEYLNSLRPHELHQRAHDLYKLGWTLEAIGSALSPAKGRSTVRNWVSSTEKSTSRIVLDAPTPEPVRRESTQERKSPGLDEDTIKRLQYLAPRAKKYRAKMSSTSEPAVANTRLTRLCKEQYSKGVTIRELAEASGVTYRAMYKRVHKQS